MFVSTPKKFTLTLVFYIALTLALVSVSEAKDIHRRDHASLNRMVKKRAPPDSESSIDQVGSGFGLGPRPKAAAKAPGTEAATGTGAGTTSAGATGTGTGTGTSTGTGTGTGTGTTSPTGTPTGTDISTSDTTTTSTTSTTSTSTTSTSSSSSTSVELPTSSVTPTTVRSLSQTVALVTSTVEGDEPTAAPQKTGSMSKGGKTTLITLAAIAGSIGGVAIIWTIIRKMVLKPSDQFEDRMAPIDWQPTSGGNSDDSGLPVHRRTSIASSFHSGSGHDGSNMAGRGMGGGGYGATADYGANNLAGVPDHDFTAGATHLAPVGGYADLARGPSPGPQMQEYGHAPAAYGGGYQQDPYDYNAHGPRY